MQARKEPVSICSITSANSSSKSQIESVLKKAEQLQTDPNIEERLDLALCKCCFYVNTSRMGGASITTKPCGICEREMMFPSTATDKICPTCAHENGLCKRCGADIELKVRRKKYPFQQN